MSTGISSPSRSRRPSGAARSTLVVTVLCWIAVLLDGFDMVVLGAVIPSMMDDPAWNLTAGEGTQIATSGLIGMTVGALAIGILVEVSTLWIPSDIKYVGALGVLILILLVRPQGLLGRRERIG